jgi:hypothetical protein
MARRMWTQMMKTLSGCLGITSWVSFPDLSLPGNWNNKIIFSVELGSQLPSLVV